MRIGIFPCHGMAELPRILFGHEQGNLRSTRLALVKWRKRGRRKSEKRISCQILRNSPGVSCYRKKNGVKVVLFRCYSRSKKLAFHAFLSNEQCNVSQCSGNRGFSSGFQTGTTVIPISRCNEHSVTTC